MRPDEPERIIPIILRKQPAPAWDPAETLAEMQATAVILDSPAAAVYKSLAAQREEEKEDEK